MIFNLTSPQKINLNLTKETASSIKSKTDSFNKEMQIWSDNYWGKIGVQYHRDKWIHNLNENIQPQFRDLYKFILKSLVEINENLFVSNIREYLRAFKKETILFYDDWYDSHLKIFIKIKEINKTLDNCDFQFDISSENKFKFDQRNCFVY